MKVLIDHSGLHSSTRPIFGKIKDMIDLKSLFQLSTLIIFSNEINLTVFDDGGVTNRTQEIIEKLKKIGIEDNFVNLHIGDIEFLKKVCKETADDCASEIKYLSLQNKVNTVGLMPEALPNNTLAKRISFLELIDENITETEMKEKQEMYIQKKMDGATHYMFSVSKKLRKSLKEIVNYNPQITQNQLFQLDSYLRFRLNEIIGLNKGIKYTPSVGRASILRKGNNFILSEISKSIDNAIKEYSGRKIITPSLIQYLHLKSKGSPYKMIEESLQIREKSKELRNWLILLTNEMNDQTAEGKFKIMEQIKELSNALLWDLNIGKPKLSDVFEISLSYGIIPNINIKNKELLMYLKYLKQKKKVSILTEISKETIFIDSEIDLNEIYKNLST